MPESVQTVTVTPEDPAEDIFEEPVEERVEIPPENPDENPPKIPPGGVTGIPDANGAGVTGSFPEMRLFFEALREFFNSSGIGSFPLI
jgi:hypothetical protein